jgi:hypothetical protein
VSGSYPGIVADLPYAADRRCGRYSAVTGSVEVQQPDFGRLVKADAGMANTAVIRDNCGVVIKLREISMAKGEQKGNRESKKPKKEKIKTIAAAPSQKAAGWQPSFGSSKKK